MIKNKVFFLFATAGLIAATSAVKSRICLNRTCRQVRQNGNLLQDVPLYTWNESTTAFQKEKTISLLLLQNLDCLLLLIKAINLYLYKKILSENVQIYINKIITQKLHFAFAVISDITKIKDYLKYLKSDRKSKIHRNLGESK